MVARLVWDQVVRVRVSAPRHWTSLDLLIKIWLKIENWKLKIYKMRVSYNGNTSAFQAEARGPIPLTRSEIKISPNYSGRFFVFIIDELLNLC